MITIQDLTNKRKQRWNELNDTEYDRILVEAICDKILDSEELRQEIIEKPYLLIECCFTIVDKNKKPSPSF